MDYVPSLQAQFFELCRKGKLEQMQQLYQLNPNDIDIDEEGGYAMRMSCWNGHIENAKWLYSLGADIHMRSEMPFRVSCEYGHLEIAKWLYSLGGVDIHALQGYAFRRSCECGHLETAKWLYSLGVIDTCASKDYKMIVSCLDAHIDMVRFLLELEDWSKSDFCVGSIWFRQINEILTKNDILAKLLFDHKIRLTDEMMEKCVKMRESIIGTVTNHLIADLANIVYLYV
jgi:hypothetical protein